MFKEHWIDSTFGTPWTALEEKLMNLLDVSSDRMLDSVGESILDPEDTTLFSFSFKWPEFVFSRGGGPRYSRIDIPMPEFITRLALRRLIKAGYVCNHTKHDDIYVLTRLGRETLSRKRAYESGTYLSSVGVMIR